MAVPDANPVQALATGIQQIADAMEDIRKTGLKRSTIVVLIHAKTGIAKRDIEAVLSSLDDMTKDWLQS
jgi:hypothetical protein